MQLNINNSQKIKAEIYLKAKGEFSIGPQTKDGATIFGFGTKSNIGITTVVASIEILATLDQTIINISVAENINNIEDLEHARKVRERKNKS